MHLNEPFLQGGLVILALLVTIGWLLWQRHRRAQRERERAEEETRRKALLAGAVILRCAGEVWRRATGCGQIPFVAIGTYAANLLPFMLKEFERAGAADFVGVIYLLELSDEQQQMSLAEIPPAFRDRVIVAQCPNWSAGLNGATLRSAWDDRHLWFQDVTDGAAQWLGRMQRETKPSLLLCLISPGGMAALGRPVVEAFHERYPHLPIYGMTILDHKTGRRQHFPAIRAFYSQGGLVRGFIIADNRRDYRRADLGIVLLAAAMVGGTWVGSLPEPLFNGLADVFPESKPPGGVATISVWAEMLPVYYLPPHPTGLKEVYYSKATLLEEKAMRGIKADAEHPELQALPLEPAELGSTRICSVVAPVVPAPDFQTSATRIDRGLEDWRAQRDPDLTVQYASIGAVLQPETRETPLVVVLLQRIQGGPDAVDHLALGAPVDPKFLPPSKEALVIKSLEQPRSRRARRR